MTVCYDVPYIIIHTNSPTLCHYTSLGKINSTAMTGHEPGRKVSAKRWDELMSGKRLGEGVTGPSTRLMCFKALLLELPNLGFS